MEWTEYRSSGAGIQFWFQFNPFFASLRLCGEQEF